jgi:hypothetical protein
MFTNVLPDLVCDCVCDLDGRPQLDLHDVDEVVFGQKQQGGAVNVVRTKHLKEKSKTFGC